MKKIIIKTVSSERELRSNLCWISTVTRWELDEDDQKWLISFGPFNDEVEFKFERLRNDYKLRLKLQTHTGLVRNSNIDNIVRNIASRLAE